MLNIIELTELFELISKGNNTLEQIFSQFINKFGPD